jgi:triosephosphate isomerase
MGVKMSNRIPLIAGNWKMNLNLLEAASLIKSIRDNIKGLSGIEVLVAPPYTALSVVKGIIGDSDILLSAQNMHWETKGAFTGEISGRMIKEAGCSHVILGHSERRSLFEERDEMIDHKVKAAFEADLVPIVCIGESLEEREAGETFGVVGGQLEGSLACLREAKAMPPSLILAYEPVWAIGTGRTATPEQAQEVHQLIRGWLRDHFGKDTASQVRLLYGGSVKPENIKELMSMPDIDGALVGGASLKAEAFIPIIQFQSCP